MVFNISSAQQFLLQVAALEWTHTRWVTLDNMILFVGIMYANTELREVTGPKLCWCKSRLSIMLIDPKVPSDRGLKCTVAYKDWWWFQFYLFLCNANSNSTEDTDMKTRYILVQNNLTYQVLNLKAFCHVCCCFSTAKKF